MKGIHLQVAKKIFILMQVFSSSFITVSTYRISGCIEVGQQLTIDEIL